ncbi:MAG: pseudouridine-5'-phosphate glycosidase [Anaerolineales bacterium]
MSVNLPDWLAASPAVEQALQQQDPLVALESTVITHGLPRPENLSLASALEQIISDLQAVPATIGLLEGIPHVGLSSEELEKLALDPNTIKINRRDLGPARAKGWSGGTTVSATMVLAHAAGISIFATGGIGGVHPGNRGDVSMDLTELARTPVAVVSAGAKAILDLPRTLEWLETAGVPVIGFQTEEFPAFYAASSGLPVSVQAESAEQVATILKAHWSIYPSCGALVCVPPPPEESLAFDVMMEWISQAEREASAEGVRGKQLTPYLLSRLEKVSQGATVRTNLALLKNNARVGAQVARAFVSDPGLK